MKCACLSIALATVVTVFSSADVLAQTFPTRPIRIVVPFTPGGSNDVLARAIGERLQSTLGQPVVVENRAGASGNIGADLVAKSPPDGYNLLIAANNIMSINPALFQKMPFDSIKDFDPVTLLGRVPVVLVVNPSIKAGSVKELISLAKAKPGGLTYASSGMGSPQHLSAELFKSMTRTDITHVPYKGAAPAIADVLGGQVDMQFGAINSLLPHIRSGRLKALGVAGNKRVPALPDVPTVSEAGVQGFESDIWVALVAPARTSAAIVETLNREVGKILAMSDVKDRLAEQGIEAQPSSAVELGKLIDRDLKRWAEVVKGAGIRAE